MNCCRRAAHRAPAAISAETARYSSANATRKARCDPPQKTETRVAMTTSGMEVSGKIVKIAHGAPIVAPVRAANINMRYFRARSSISAFSKLTGKSSLDNIILYKITFVNYFATRDASSNEIERSFETPSLPIVTP